MELSSYKSLIKNRLSIVIVATLVVTLFTACNSEEPEREIPHPVTVDKLFTTIVTDMVSSSAIALPDGINFEGFIINSFESLDNLMPSEVIEDSPEYQKIDFKDSSLISLKCRIFYDFNDIEYRIYKTEDKLVVQQIIHKSKSMTPRGYFIMSNLMIEKIPDNISICLQQGYLLD